MQIKHIRQRGNLIADMEIVIKCLDSSQNVSQCSCYFCIMQAKVTDHVNAKLAQSGK